jgi:hypothetical protein
MGYDMRPLDTLSEKEKVFNEAIENNWLLFFEHDRLNELGSLQQTEKGARINELLLLKGI